MHSFWFLDSLVFGEATEDQDAKHLLFKMTDHSGLYFQLMEGDYDETSFIDH